jgi:THAP domain
MKQKWITSIENFGSRIIVCKYSTVCSDHFLTKDYESERRLKKSAIPSVFLTFENKIQSEHQQSGSKRHYYEILNIENNEEDENEEARIPHKVSRVSKEDTDELSDTEIDCYVEANVLNESNSRKFKLSVILSWNDSDLDSLSNRELQNALKKMIRSYDTLAKYLIKFKKLVMFKSQ